MKNINNKSIVFGFKILALLAFGVMIVPAIASADYGVNYTFGTAQGPATYPTYNYPQYPAPVYTSVPAVYTAQPVVYNTTTVRKTIVAKAPAPKSTTTSAVAYYIAVPPGSTVVNSIPAGATVENPTYSNLAATAITGSDTFLPSGLVQWVLFAIFILILIIIGRTIFGAKANYYATPLKHE